MGGDTPPVCQWSCRHCGASNQKLRNAWTEELRGPFRLCVLAMAIPARVPEPTRDSRERQRKEMDIRATVKGPQSTGASGMHPSTLHAAQRNHWRLPACLPAGIFCW